MKRSYTYLKGLLTLALAALTGGLWAAAPVATWTDFSQDVRQQIDLSDGKTATVVVKLTFTEAAASLTTDATFASVTTGEVTATDLKNQGDGLHLHAYSSNNGIGANFGNGGAGTWADNRSAVGTNPHVVIVTLAWENDACILKYYVDGELAGRGAQKSFSLGNVSAMYFNTATNATTWSFSNAELYDYAFTAAQVTDYLNPGAPTLTSAADTDNSGKISWAEFEAVRGDSTVIKVSGALEVEIAGTDSPTLTALTINKVNESGDSLTFTGTKSLWSGNFALTTEIPVTATNWTNNPSLTLAGSGDVTIKKGDKGIGLVNGGYTGKLTLDDGQQVTNMNNSAFSMPFTVGDGGALLHSNSQNGWNVSSVISGSGTLTFNAANPLYLTAESTNFTGDAVINSGTVVLGNTNTNGGGKVSHFGNADTTITIKNGAAFKTHFGGGGHTNQTAYAPSFILEPGATLGNIDGHTNYTGDIVVNQGGDANSTSVFTCYWDKTNIISGTLSGEGKLELQSQNSAHTLKIAPASGKTNTFAGTYFVNDSRVTLWAAMADAVAAATVQLANNGNFALGGDVKVVGLLGTQGTVKSDVQGTARILTLCGTSDLTALTITDDVTIAIAETATGTITLPAGAEEGLTIPANCTLVLKLSPSQVVAGYTNKATVNGTFGGFLDSNGVAITDGVNGGVYVPQNKVKWENGAWDAEITTGAILQINFGEVANQTCEVAFGDITSIGALQVSGAVAGEIAITANGAVTIPVVAMNNTGTVEIASTQTINVTDKISGSGALTVTSGNISMTNAAVVATDYSGTLTLKNGVTLTWGDNSGNVVADTDYALGASLVLESGSTFKPNLHTGKSLNKGKAGKMRLATTVTLAGGTIEHPDGSYFYTKILVEEDSIININWDKGIAIERLLGDAALTIEGKNTAYGCAFVSVWWTQDQQYNPTAWYTGTLKLKSGSSTYDGGFPKMEFYPDTGDAFKKAHVQFLNGNVKYNMAGNSRCMGALSGAAADIVATGNPTLTIGGYAGADAVGAYEGTISGTNITLSNGATLTMTGTLGTLSDDVATYGKAIALNANSHLKLGLAKKTILNGVISGSGALTVQSGAIELNAENTATGTITINAGATVSGTGTVAKVLKIENGATLDASAGALTADEVWLMGAANAGFVTKLTLPEGYAADTPIINCATKTTEVAADLTKIAPDGYKCVADGNTIKLAVAKVNVTLPAAPANTKWYDADGNEVKAGTIAVDPNTNVTLTLKADDGYVFADGTTKKEVTVNAGENGATVTTPDVTAAEGVAKVGEALYTTLEAAIAAAGEKPVVLVKDITLTAKLVIEGTVTLDLAGKTLTLADVGNDYSITIKGALTINDSGSTGKVIVAENGYGIGLAKTATALTINGGTFDGSAHDYAYIIGAYAGTVTINGGTFISPYCVANAFEDSKIIVTGGTFENGGDYAAYFTVMGGEGCKIAVSGGTFTNEILGGYMADDYVLAKNGDGTFSPVEGTYVAEIVWAPYVARYTTLADAIAAAGEGDTITLLADVAANEAIVVEESVTIDLNEKIITGAAYPVIRVQNGADVIVKNGTITNNDYIFVLGSSDKTSAGNLTIESGSYTGVTTVASVTKGTLTIKGGTFAVDMVDYGATYLLNCYDPSYKAGTAKIEVTGGKFLSFNPANNAAEGTGTNFCADGYIAVADGEYYTVQQGAYVAQIGTAGYTTLQAAIAAAEAGDTITMLTDVVATEALVIEESVTLDLGGKTIAGVVYPVIRVQSGADVIVKNGTITNNDYIFVLGSSDKTSAGSLTIESGSYTGVTTVASVTKGTLTIKGGTFAVAAVDYGATYLLNCYDATYKTGDAEIVVKGGTFNGFNPANNAAEGAGTNFCADGYTAVAEGDVYTVTEIVLPDGLEAALDAVNAPVEAKAAIVKAMADAGVTEIKGYTIKTKGADAGADAEVDAVANILAVFDVEPTVDDEGNLAIAYEFGISNIENNGDGTVTITAAVNDGVTIRAGVKVMFTIEGYGATSLRASEGATSVTTPSTFPIDAINGKKITVKAMTGGIE